MVSSAALDLLTVALKTDSANLDTNEFCKA